MPRTRPFRVVVAAPPAEVRARLAAATHLRPFPAFGRVLARADRPLAGRVADDGSFRVSESRPDLLTRLRPVAVGRIEAAPGGSAVTGIAGMPAWVTWYLRVVWSALAVGALVTGGLAVTGAAALGAIAPVVAVGVLLAAVSIGLHVSHADAGVDALVERVQAAAVPSPTAERDPVRVARRVEA